MTVRKTILLLSVLILCSCGAKKHLGKPSEPELVWHTAQVTNTMLTLTADEQTFNVFCQMQTVRDSMIVISVMPVMNMELLRIEATPDEVFVIEKMNHRYTRLPMAQARQAVVPALKWQDLQAFAAGERMQPDDTAELGYQFKQHTVRLSVTYGTIAYDMPVNVRHIRLDRYQFVDISALLP